MSKRFEGKVAVVTGASKGIGAAIAKQFASEGASVVVNYATSREGADRVVSEIKRNGGKAVAVQADMAKKSDVGRLFDEAKKAFGRLDVLINNAGIYEFAPLDTISEENFHKQFDINVLGLIFASQEAAKYFGAEGGSIVNISSITSTLTPPNSAVYSGTKAAVDATTKVLAKELGPKKIRVNAVNPGMVDTEGWRAAGLAESELRKFVESQTPLGRIGKPDDIAPAVAFFASPDSSWITGETLTIAGGFR
jgi:3-oxoacyl-[acyl-carrier protein] reductase